MKALRKLTWVELKLFTRDPLSLVFTLALPFFFLIVLNGVFGNEVAVDPEEDVWRGVGPSEYYVPAYIGLVMAATGVLSMPVRLASYRERGVLRRFRASGMPLWVILGSQIAIALMTAIVGAVSITVASTLIYGTELLPVDGLPFIAAFVMAAFAFSAVGVLLGSVLPTSRSAQGAGLMLFFVMFLLSGAGPPRDVLTGPMRGVGNSLPLTWVIIMLQDPWLGFGWAATASLVVLGILVGSVALSVRFFRWD
jgi:ABC-2 type transport system permease protein